MGQRKSWMQGPGFLGFCLILFGNVEAAPPDAPTNYTSGPFVIHYDPHDLPTLQVMQQVQLVWFTSMSQSPFLAAAMVAEKTTQIGGDYVMKSHVVDTCTKLSIAEVGTKPPLVENGFNTFYMRGVLCDAVAVEMTLQAVQLSDGSGTSVHGNGTIIRHHLMFNASMGANPHYNQLHLVYGCEDDEAFYGFGAQYSKLNMKGSVVPMFLSEQGVGRGLQPLTAVLDLSSPGAGGSWSTTYTRVPHYISSHRRSLYLESLERAWFDLTETDTVTLRVDSNTISGRIISGSSPLQLISSYTALVGRMPPLPAWVGQGAVLGLEGGSASVLQTLDTVKQKWGNLSDVVGVWLQDWTGLRTFGGANDLPRVGLWWNWEVDTTHYPGWAQLVMKLKAQGIRTLSYVNPLFSNISNRGTPFTHNYYEEGLKKGYFVKEKSGNVWTGYSDSVLLDISNPLAYQWMVDIIAENMLGPGVCGWMCDFGESLPLDAMLHGNSSAPQLHSLYPSLWGQLNADAIRQARGKSGGAGLCAAEEVVYFMRSGNSLSPANTRLFWLGDQLVTWDAYDGLATVVMGMLSQGLSGYSLSHSDIGGFTALAKGPIRYVRSKELFFRWCELAAFSTMYRTHLGTLPSQNWQFDSDNDTLHHFFRMAVLFESWDFYRTQLMQEASLYGWPVVRHMMLVYPDNPRVYKEVLNKQFMVGDSLLVAPVLNKGQDEVEVFLPMKTSWVLLWGESTIVYEGSDNYVKFPAPLGRPCVLYSTATDVGPKLVENLKQRKLI